LETQKQFCFVRLTLLLSQWVSEWIPYRVIKRLLLLHLSLSLSHTRTREKRRRRDPLNLNPSSSHSSSYSHQLHLPPLLIHHNLNYFNLDLFSIFNFNGYHFFFPLHVAWTILHVSHVRSWPYQNIFSLSQQNQQHSFSIQFQYQTKTIHSFW